MKKILFSILFPLAALLSASLWMGKPGSSQGAGQIAPSINVIEADQTTPNPSYSGGEMVTTNPKMF